ncbi:MAG: acyl-CoA thioester hydrolase/BAAT C-terminal domain-containing protein [Pleurocapsa sp. MO_226.B13]|nr:acyl-CoA thioester hydrolase/BAAT C-terminal domain-containing protein [Pleurocapsa sp. MO_226.B13]
MLKIKLSPSSVGAVIYQPVDLEPIGGIVLLHGSEGGSAGKIDIIAALLAAHGFLAMPKPYNKADALLTRPDIKNIPLEGTEEALFCMREIMTPYRKKVGLYGVSRGAEQALLISQLLAEESSIALPDALAVHAPTSKIKPAFILANYQFGVSGMINKLQSLWRLGKAQPAWCWRNSYKRTLPGTDIQIEKYPHPLLITHGKKDLIWSVEESQILEQRRQANRLPTRTHYFENEGHILGLEARNQQLEILLDFFTSNLSNTS